MLLTQTYASQRKLSVVIGNVKNAYAPFASNIFLIFPGPMDPTSLPVVVSFSSILLLRINTQI
ncbi:MAG: hypothetical protein UT21_C0006G0006 [Candidatus Woesebacteria bacterium GW2011_GWA1_39_11b]|nr:MAG: hypothetical protein UT21_C0006G0006 [Candidatus Woesebacteria bacterium GW2011_GWA1_39_11b]